jgi:tetrahydromethanopterin S-methyltransferase subunit G
LQSSYAPSRRPFDFAQGDKAALSSVAEGGIDGYAILENAMTAHPWEPRLAHIEGSFNQLEKRLTDFMHHVDTRFTQVDARFNQVDGRFEQIDHRFAQIDARFAQIDARFGVVEYKIDVHFRWMVGLIVVAVLAPFLARFLGH